MNQMLASAIGCRVEDEIGRPVAEVVPLLWPALEPIYRHVLDTGEAVVNREVSGPLPTDGGRIHAWLTNLNPIEVNGFVTGIAIIVIDITDRKQLEESQATLTRAVVSALSASVEMRDPYTAGHQERVAQLAVAIAGELRLEPHEIDEIGLAARIHDIGKLSVPAELLTLSGPAHRHRDGRGPDAQPGRLRHADEGALSRARGGHGQAASRTLRRLGVSVRPAAVRKSPSGAASSPWRTSSSRWLRDDRTERPSASTSRSTKSGVAQAPVTTQTWSQPAST